MSAAQAHPRDQSGGYTSFDLQVCDLSSAQPEGIAEANGPPRERSRHQPYYNGGFRAFRNNVFDLETWVIFVGHLCDPLAQLWDTAPSLALIPHDRVRGEGREHRIHVLTVDGLEVRPERFRQLRIQRDLPRRDRDPCLADHRFGSFGCTELRLPQELPV